MVPSTHMSQPPDGILIGLAVFAQYVSVTNTQTDTQNILHVTSVAVAYIYVMHVMQPN